MKLSKETSLAIAISSILLIISIIVSMVIAFKQVDVQEYNQDNFKLVQDHLVKMELVLVGERIEINAKLDSLDKLQVNLSNDLIKYNTNLDRSVRKIKRYKNEIVQHNYRDSSAVSIINRINSNSK